MPYRGARPRGRSRTTARLTARAQPGSPPPTVGIYGPGIAMDGLGNLRVGFSGQQHSYRFRATQSSPLVSVRIYIIANGNTGYSNGTGGTIRCRLRADDGTANHFPTGAALATQTVTPGNPTTIGAFPVITFPSPFTVTAGTLYHLHWDNTDADPTTNHVSLDEVWQETPVQDDLPFQPKWQDNLDWFQLISTDSGATWAPEGRATPIADITYGNGAHQGLSYMEISYGAGEFGVISGAGNMIREAFTVSGSDKIVTSVGVRLWRHTGSDPLSIRLETAAGTEIETVTIPAANIITEANPPPTALDNGSGSGYWATAQFTVPRTLTLGSAYNLRLSCAGTSEYRMTPIRRGSSVNFNAATWFSDGLCQKTTDGTNWTSLGRVANSNDLQFYFTTSL